MSDYSQFALRVRVTRARGRGLWSERHLWRRGLLMACNISMIGTFALWFAAHPTFDCYSNQLTPAGQSACASGAWQTSLLMGALGVFSWAYFGLWWVFRLGKTMNLFPPWVR
jgi:hypothetical protein